MGRGVGGEWILGYTLHIGTISMPGLITHVAEKSNRAEVMGQLSRDATLAG